MIETVELAVAAVATYRATEIVADLRNAAETLFFPMRSVGYWDVRSGDHLCPQTRLGGQCPHMLPPNDHRRVDYLTTVERELEGVLDVHFPHAQVHVFLS